MASSKNKQSTPVRSNDYLPKAGPRSANGGRKKKSTGRAGNTADVPLFDRLRNDQLEQLRLSREEAKQQAIAKQQEFLAAQADRARTLLGDLPGLTGKVAGLVVSNFLVAKPSNGMKRPEAAELMIINQLTLEELAHTQSVNNGRYLARKALSSAFHQLKMAEMAAAQPATRQLETV